MGVHLYEMDNYNYTETNCGCSDVDTESIEHLFFNRTALNHGRLLLRNKCTKCE